MKTEILAEPVLVGREREIEELQQNLDSTIEGKGMTVFVSGEAGSGKTRLTREFLDSARKRGVAVMAGWCLSDSAVPYFPFIEAFNTYVASLDEEEQPVSLSQNAPQIGLAAAVQIGSENQDISALLTGPGAATKLGKPQVLSPQVWKDHAFAAVARSLHSISAQEPIILFLEDIHWADSASLALLQYIARSVTSERIMVLATFRNEALTADAEGHPHPLAEALRAMGREDLFTEIKLSNLNQADVEKIAENMIGGCLQSELAEKLTVESRGNPLFVVESLRMLSERKSLFQENNQWRLAVDELGIPSKVKDIILRRLAILKYSQRRILDAASVIGEKFNVELLATVLGQDILDVLETLNVIAQSTSIVCVEENFYRFDHAKSREVLYDELSLPLKRGYHSRVAEKLENTGKGSRLPVGDLAYHFAEAGNKEKAIKFALAAGKEELAKYSNMQAIKHFQYALQNISEGNAEEKRVALEGLGDAYAANYTYAEAIKTFDELAAFETGALRLHALRKASDAAYYKGDRPDLLVEYLKKAQELAVDDRLEMARLLDNRGKAWGWAGRGDLKMDLADYNAALQVFEEENSLADVAEALCRSGVVTTLVEESREKAIGKLLRSRAIFRELGDIRKEIEATLNAGMGFGDMELIPETMREYANVLKLGEKLYLFTELARASVYLGICYELDFGRVSEGLALTLKALEYSKKTDATRLQGLIYALLVRQYSKLGDLKHADEYFDKMNKLPPEMGTRNLGVVTVGQFFREVYYAAKGFWEECNKSFKEARLEKTKLSLNYWVQKIHYRTDYAWVLEKQGRIEEAKVQLDEVQKILDQVDERFRHGNVELSVMLPRKVLVGDEFETRLDLVNIARSAAMLTRIEGVTPIGFNVVSLPSSCSLQDGSLEMKEKTVAPFQVETIKLKLKVEKAGSYVLNPEVSYLDDEGKTKTFRISPITVTVQPAKPAFETLPGRVTTGTAEVDRLLLGGIPEGYAVVLAASSSDERELLIKRFLEAGAETGQTTFYLTGEAGNGKALAEKYPSNFYVFLCNPKADAMIQNLPNVIKLKGVENLTEIDIALTKAFRTLNPSATGPKRACVEIVSDVLLQHHAVVTRKWLSGLLPDLKAKGFTTLAVIDPQMHPQEEVQAIMGLFEGEIRVYERETANGAEKVLRIRKLDNQKYSKNELILTTEKLGESK